MAFSIDTSTEFGKRAQAKLENEQVAWLTTVDPSGRPYPSPIWFLLEEDGTLLMYSRPNQKKLSNISENAFVAFNFNTDEHGNDVVIFEGAAVLDESANPSHEHPKYLEKYHKGILSLGMTDESFSEAYSVPIRVILQKLRGF